MASTSESLIARLRQGRAEGRAETAPARAGTMNLIKVALSVPVATLLLLAVVITLVKVLAGGALRGLVAQVGAGWLVLNQAPLTVGGVTVGALPLVPTIALIIAVAVVTARAADKVESLHEVGSIAAAALAGPLLTTALALAVVADGAAVSSIGQPAPLPAFGYTLLVQGLGVGIGVGRRCRRPLLDLYEFPPADRVGLRGGLLGFAALCAGGALLVVAGFAAGWVRIGDLIATGSSFDGYLGLTVLSVLYLPNVVIAGLGVAVGATARAGAASVDVFGAQGGTVPPLPILGVFGDVQFGAFGLLLFALPLAAGALVGWYCLSTDAIKNLRAVGVAAAVTAALVALTAALASGRAGDVGPFGVSPPLAAVYAFGWIGGTGALVAGGYRSWRWWRARRAGISAAGVGFDLDELLDSDEFAGLEIVDPDDLDPGDLDPASGHVDDPGDIDDSVDTVVLAVTPGDPAEASEDEAN